MSVDFFFRIIGMVAFAIVGARLGVSVADLLNQHELAVAFFFALLGILFGLILTPYFTVKPIRFLSRVINLMPIEVLFTTVLGLLLGLLVALLVAYPFSLLEEPWGNLLPPVISIVLAYLMTTIFHGRS